MSCREVRKFTIACNPNSPDRPVPLTKEQIEFISEMVNDELDELREAKTIGEQMDALVDAVYYIYDTACRHGMNLDPIFNIVHQANMEKIQPDGTVKRLPNGKIEKPNGWEDPGDKISNAILKQHNCGAFNEN